jgi:hypothetical protein
MDALYDDFEIELPSQDWQHANPGWQNVDPASLGWRPGPGNPKGNLRPEPAGKPVWDSLECFRLPAIGAAKIPPRPWAYGRFLLSGSAAVIGAVDGGGKGAIAVVMALAMITGKPLLGERVWRAGPVGIVTYEDDEEEWHRRIAAACAHYELDYEHVLANIHFLRKRDGRVSFAAVENGGVIFPDGREITDKLQAVKAVLLIVDPFNHAHDFDDGNNNVMIAKVAGELSKVARDSGVAVLVLHHLRKGANGTPDDLMGATSLRATFRSCRILARMSPEVAGKMEVLDPWRYVRIVGSKENYAPPPEKGTWFKLIGVHLGNATDDYPDGDEVAVATSWQARAMFEGMSAGALAAVFCAIRQSVHGPNKQAKHTPWVGKLIMEIGGRSKDEAGKIVLAWLKNGVLEKAKYYHSESHHQVEKVVLNEAKVSEILTQIGVVNAPAA